MTPWLAAVMLSAVLSSHGAMHGGGSYVRRVIQAEASSEDYQELTETARADSKFDEDRSPKECFCGESRNVNLWQRFQGELHQGLQQDPNFQGDWVHTLCGKSYPIIFRIISVDSAEDDSFVINSDCPAGLLAMIIVCAQSAALRRVENHEALLGLDAVRASPSPMWSQLHSNSPHNVATAEEEVFFATGEQQQQWWRTRRVVKEEGLGVGDFFGNVALEDCFKHCAETSSCRSFAHGPHGCHLKARCVGRGESMVPEGVQGEDYKTYFREPCIAASTSPAGATLDASSHIDELRSMMTFAIRALEFCFHCLDASPWPFLLSEVLENYALSVEAPRDFVWQQAAGRLLGSTTRPGLWEDVEAALPSLKMHVDPDAPRQKPSVYLMLLRLQVRWTRGLENEAGFWRQKLSLDPEENDSLQRLRRWLDTGEVTWSYDDLCFWLEDARRRQLPEVLQRPPRILNAGSGPFAPRPLDCKLDSMLVPPGSALAGADVVPWPVPVVAADGLARYYLRVMDEHGLSPPYSPKQCPVEELHLCLPTGHFDVVHIRNALDHTFNPVLGIERMLHVTRPGGWVLLRHARNEGVPGKFRNGLHQWAFDVRSPSAENNGVGSTGADWSFLIWNPELEVDVTEHLLKTGLAAEVRTELKDHPSADAPPDEKYVWVDIRKPTAAEAAARRAAEIASVLAR